MFRDKYTVGNVCLVVFLAFIFSIITAIVKVEPAAAAPMDMNPTTDSGGQSGQTITIQVRLHPVTATNFGSLKYYVRIINESDGAERLPQTQFQLTSSEAVYGSVYGKLLNLVYANAPASVQLGTTFSVVYSAIVYDAVYQSVYLTLRHRPPETPPAPPPSGGGGGGGGGATTVSTGVGDLTVSAGVAQLSVDAGQLTNLIANTPPDTPITLTINAELLRSTVSYDLPAAAVNQLRDRIVQMRGENSTITIPMEGLAASLPLSEGGTLRVTIAIVLPATSQRAVPYAFASRTTTDAFGYMVASAQFLRVSPTYRVTVEWVTKTDVKAVDLTSLKGLMKLTVLYDPQKVVDTDLVAAVKEAGPGSVVYQPRVLVEHENRRASLFIDNAGDYTVVQSTRQFKDIASHWGRKDIASMAARDIARGQPDGSFDPNGAVTRAQFAALLVRALGKDMAAPTTPKFKDVPAWAWHYGSVETAARLGLVNGYEDGTFRPDARITRQEMATMIVRAMDLFPGAPTVTGAEVTKTLGEFADGNTASAWARENIAKAYKTGIVQGRTMTTFQPISDATRAESIVMLKRMLKHYGHIQ